MLRKFLFWFATWLNCQMQKIKICIHHLLILIPIVRTCVYVMRPILNTHTSTRSLYEDSSRYEHCFVHPKFLLQIDLLPSISRGLLRSISSDWRNNSNKTLKNEGFRKRLQSTLRMKNATKLRMKKYKSKLRMHAC